MERTDYKEEKERWKEIFKMGDFSSSREHFAKEKFIQWIQAYESLDEEERNSPKTENSIMCMAVIDTLEDLGYKKPSIERAEKYHELMKERFENVYKPRSEAFRHTPEIHFTPYDHRRKESFKRLERIYDDEIYAIIMQDD
jgi:hypothetical protein